MDRGLPDGHVLRCKGADEDRFRTVASSSSTQLGRCAVVLTSSGDPGPPERTGPWPEYQARTPTPLVRMTSTHP